MQITKTQSEEPSIESLIIENRNLFNQKNSIKTRYDLFKQSTADGYWEWDLVNSTLVTSDRWKITLGITDFTKSLTVDNWIERLHPDDKERVFSDLNKHLDGKVDFYYSEYRMRHEDGHYLHMIDRGQASFSSSGQPELVIGSCTNITDIIEKSEQLSKSEQTLNTILSCMSEGILVIDIQGKFIYANSNFSNLVGLTIEQVKGTVPTDPRYRVIHQDGSEYPGDTHPSTITLKTGKPVKNDIQGIIFNDEINWVSVNSTPMFSPNSDVIIGAVMTFTDITEKIKKEQHIKKLAFVDYLTGLPNRNSLDQKFNELIQTQGSVSTAVLMIDIDRFKLINDSRGHSIGDRLLKIVATRFSNCKRLEDFICRVGGDEFIAIIPDVDKPEAIRIAQRFIDCLQDSILIDEFYINISASVGICMLPDDAVTLEDLMVNSDIAMYHAKASGRGCVRTYDKRLSLNLREQHDIGNALMKAIKHDELSVHYQPQINSITGKMVGAEALLRWKHSTLGNISPAKFIPIAEDSGVIISIGKWLINEVCKTICCLGSQLQEIPVSINLSAKQFSDPELIDFIESVLTKYNLNEKSIAFEITESILIKENPITDHNIKCLNSMGIDLAIDDFGTGYSSLSYLKHLPIQCLKIDKSFIDKITVSQTDQMITQTIVTLANSMSITVLAEGVEQIEQMEVLKKLGCHFIQGYLYSKPLPLEDFKVYLNGQEYYECQTVA